MFIAFDLIASAALLGVVVAIREGEFPGWGPMIGLVCATGLAEGLVDFILPTPINLLGSACGACAAAFLIAWLCHSTLRRSAVTAGIWLSIRIVLAVGWILIA